MRPDGLLVSSIDFLLLPLQTKSTQGDKNRHILNELMELDDASIDTFVENLSSSQPNVADKIMAVKSKVQNSRKSIDSKCDFNFASDFDPGKVVLFLNNMYFKWYGEIGIYKKKKNSNWKRLTDFFLKS